MGIHIPQLFTVKSAQGTRFVLGTEELRLSTLAARIGAARIGGGGGGC